MNDFPKSYDPAQAESKYYGLWIEKGYFKPEVNPGGKPYCIVIPPPNVTGSLHMGHALNGTIQDILTRYKRMKGFRALWLPGMDHAGIATQNVVERQLEAEGTNRHSLGREAFIERVWQWKAEYGGRITNQLRKLGASCDWSRERFTLDEGLSRAVREVFVKLHEDGLLYRDNRLINWCPRCHTALSDLEVEHEEQAGKLTHMLYPFVAGEGGIVVATTRPETMLGDTAVAVHPEDERYAGMIGKHVVLPLAGRTIPIVADKEVDPAFGTGAVKVTPSHDFNDEAIARRQNPHLPFVSVINESGKMTGNAGERYAGLDRYECRKLVVADLEKKGLILKVEDHTHAVGHCYRCRTVIEPLSTPQWYVRIKPLAEEAIKAVRKERIRLVPRNWENSYFAWMENINDWCITRQIWWGHRLPVWYCNGCGHVNVSRTDVTECGKCGSKNIRQDDDVLDTWFSSALWPFSTLGWPDDTEDLREFYPTDVLVTAFDILFFWVARMIMMGLRFRGEVPFRDVYIHALVRDSEGQKMSKSKGNVIDPLIMIDKFGADAFRFTLAAFAAQGRDVRFSEERVEGYKHFINKLWNATKFILMNLGGDFKAPAVDELSKRVEGTKRPDLASRWILSRLSAAEEDTAKAIDGYHFNDAVSAIYTFVWHEFCDWYIEVSKTDMNAGVKDTLLYCLERVVRMLQPFMPFLAEDLWLRLPVVRPVQSVVIARWPEPASRDLDAEREMAFVMDAIQGIRNIRGEFNVPPKQSLEVRIKTASDAIAGTLTANRECIERLAMCRMAEVGTATKKPAGSHIAVKEGIEAHVILEGIDMQGEIARLKKELGKVESTLTILQKKLHNPDFLGRAPEHVVAKEKAKYDEHTRMYEKITASIAKLGGKAG